jgi:hypothetical protein
MQNTCSYKCIVKIIDSTELTSVLNQTTDASLFYTRLEWLNDVKEFFLKDKLRAHCWYIRSRNWLGE